MQRILFDRVLFVLSAAAHLHYGCAGKDWADASFEDASASSGLRTVSIPFQPNDEGFVEFCFNDGKAPKTSWDSANGKNYRVTEAGCYSVSGGEIWASAPVPEPPIVPLAVVAAAPAFSPPPAVAAAATPIPSGPPPPPPAGWPSWALPPADHDPSLDGAPGLKSPPEPVARAGAGHADSPLPIGVPTTAAPPVATPPPPPPSPEAINAAPPEPEAMTEEPAGWSPYLVVSDLDGTMVGDDDATAEFTRYWDATARPGGCKLVFSTGRSLALFESLMADKGDTLAVPDVLCLAVGTRIYFRAPDGSGWAEHESWTASLGERWSGSAVRRAAGDVVSAAGSERAHFLPEAEQNEHKVSLGLKTEVVLAAQVALASALDAAAVRAKIIVSGSGDWRYLDVVAAGAGKLESLEYLRLHLGFPVGHTVACGDSGNDILMLSGRNLAVVVGNAQPDLAEWAAKERALEAAATAPGGSPKNGRNGADRLLVTTATHARGILEGLRTFGLL